MGVKCVAESGSKRQLQATERKDKYLQAKKEHRRMTLMRRQGGQAANPAAIKQALEDGIKIRDYIKRALAAEEEVRACVCVQCRDAGGRACARLPAIAPVQPRRSCVWALAGGALRRTATAAWRPS